MSEDRWFNQWKERQALIDYIITEIIGSCSFHKFFQAEKKLFNGLTAAGDSYDEP